ncbi:MAG: ABC transporter ATP-binding protein [Deltaproteobacteria bacterium]|nr:ABC transporter ATP-binding protein [Deltaproteobacteria bacterium]
MPGIELRGVDNIILHQIDLKIHDGEFLVVLGPNGAGKTTLLNVIAGLVPYTGDILFDGIGINGLPPQRRDIGYVFQDLALFPHLDVEANLAFGLNAQKRNGREARAQISRLLDEWGLRHIAHRHAGTLSGGERQKVAIARALAPEPQALLLDEPFSSLDRGTSIYLQREIRAIQRKLGITTVHVTHNQREAEEMADRIAVMYDGVIEQLALPHDIFFSPASEHIAEFIGSPNIFCCDRIRRLTRGLAEMQCGDLAVVVPDEGETVRKVAILPRDVYLSKTPIPGPDINRYTGRIDQMTTSMGHTLIRLSINGQIILAEQPAEIANRIGLIVGDPVHVVLMLKWLRVLPGPETAPLPLSGERETPSRRTRY